MNGRRPLAALLGDLADGVAGFAASGPGGIRARSLAISLPIDVRLVPTQGGYELIGDVPLFRMRTDFDPDPAMLEVEWQAVPSDGGRTP
ncbi:MAG TPA: hypothetical protein VIT38_12860 [Allosphingosinicella sp.]